jgi:hypothetical protein
MAVFQADARYVNTIYHAILGRDVDTTALANWLVFLRSGGTRQQLVSNVWNSDEHHIRQVVALYDAILHTTAPPAVLNNYVSMMDGGATEIQIAARIAAQPEGNQLYPTYASYLNELYQLILGRNASAGEQIYWQPLAGDRLTLAMQVLMTPDSFSNIVSNAYQTLLGRPASASEIAMRVAQLENGWTYGGLIQEILGSAEFNSLIGT